jgi:hypothetical protein
MAHFVEGSSEDGDFFPIDEKGTGFSFRGSAHNGFDDFGDSKDGAVVEGEALVVVAEIVVAASSAASLWFREVGGITLASQDHVRAAVAEFRIGMGGTIVEKIN